MNAISEDLIRQFPLFSALSRAQLRLIRTRSTVVEYKKGQIIYQEDSPPDAFYCILLGRVMIYTQAKDAHKTLLEYLHRGKYFGIISLLTEEPHSVTAQAINDSSILVIKKEDFNFILEKIPHLAIDLSRTLSRRLKRKDIHPKTIFESTIISVFSSYSQAGKTMYALNLALSMAKETHKRIVILDLAVQGRVHSLPKKLEISDYPVMDLSVSSVNPDKIKDYIRESKFGVGLACLHYRQEDEASVKKIISILSLLVNDYHYLILDLPSLLDKPILSILNQSDLIQILTSPDEEDLKKTRNLIENLKRDFNFHEERVNIIVNEYKLAKLSHEEEAGILDKGIFATLPKVDSEAREILVLNNPDCEYAKAVRRISRKIGECQVGLVLGVGVGYGFCHIGVLKVIEEKKIPIDIISGSSVGALIAGLWAAGKSSAEILEIVKGFKEPKHIWNMLDFTFPLLGFIKGNKLRGLLRKHLDDKTFYDLRMPLRVVASDLKRKEPRVFDRGPLVDAIMASCSMPGVFKPFKFKEEMLFDGGVIHPLPTEPLFKMGIKKIIAINVTPSREDIARQYEKLKKEITVSVPQDIKKKRWVSLRQRLKNIFKTNILDNIFSSIEILQSELVLKEAQLADIVLHPDTSGLFWMELHRADEFAKRGEEQALRNLDKIWQLVNE